MLCSKQSCLCLKIPKVSPECRVFSFFLPLLTASESQEVISSVSDLTYGTSSLSLGYLKHTQKPLYQPRVGQNHLTRNLFYKKVLSSHIMYWRLEGKNRMVVQEQNSFEYISRSPSGWCGCLGAAAHCWCPASGERTTLYISSPEKIKIQTSKSSFFWMLITFTPL